MSRGFVIVELIVALVVFAVGLLAISGVALHASQIVTRAAQLEHSVAVAEGVADSLVDFGFSESDSATTSVGRVVWRRRPDGSLQILVRGPAGPRVDLWTRGPTRVP